MITTTEVQLDLLIITTEVLLDLLITTTEVLLDLLLSFEVLFKPIVYLRGPVRSVAAV